MKILYVNCQFGMLDTIDCGAANRSTMFVSALAQLGHVDVVSFFKEEICSTLDNCDVIYSRHIPNETPTIMQRMKSMVSLLFKPWSSRSYYVRNIKREDIVDKIVSNGNYDVIACRYIKDATECGLMKYNDRLIVDVDDNLKSAIKRDLETGTKLSLLKKLKLCYELRSIGIMQERFLHNVRCSFYSNILEPPSSKSVFLHNVTSIQNCLPPVNYSSKDIILLVGWMNFAPNQDGAIHFVENVFPLIRKDIPNVELHIVGKCDDCDFVQRIGSVDGVYLLGFVKDLALEYDKCKVVIVPVYSGSGTSVKFIESVMLKRPVVSTAMGSRGFEHVFMDGIHYLLANDDRDFAEKVVYLLKNMEFSNQMCNKAYHVACEIFSHSEFMRIVIGEIKREFRYE